MRRIAVVTASNMAYKNPGMVTVDLAFEALRMQLGTEISASWHTLHPPNMRPLREYVREADLPFRFLPLEENLNELNDHDAVVFWGDFLHARHYLEQDATDRLLHFGTATDRDAARRLLRRNLLLGDAPDDLLKRTVLYGGTILHNSQSDYSDEDYGPPFARIMTRCHAVWMRDPLSATKVAHLRGDDIAEHFGADAALLLRPGDLDFLPTTGWADAATEGGVAGVFLGSRTPVPRWLKDFARELARRLDVRLEWLPWLGDARNFRTRRVEMRGGRYSLGDLLAVLSRYRIVITDTYHVCVNAWRVGTPAICIGSPTPGGPPDMYHSLNDLKKYVFYSSYDAGDF